MATDTGEGRGASSVGQPNVFISYRRQDGSGLARYLARRLRRHRLPREVVRALKGMGREVAVLRPFLDRTSVRPSDDSYEKEILPSLRAVRHLVVVATPSVGRPG